MRLSIGVPAYNQGSFLRETLESLVRQEVPFDEIVVSDNHSTDETAQVIAELQTEYPDQLRAVRPPEHLTAVGNWNFTTAQLTGDWVSLLSSDDVALPNFSGSVRRAVGYSTHASLVRGGWRNIGQDGGHIDDHYLLSVGKVATPARALYEQRFGPKASFAAFALRRDVWERVGGFPTEVTIIGDWGIWLLAGALGDSVYTGDLIACYRTGHQSDWVRRRHHVHVREMVTVFEEIMPRATELAGLGRPAWIMKASRQQFREMIISASHFNAEGRPQLAEAFRPWAEATGEHALFDRFARGEVIQSWNPMRWMRPVLRRAASLAGVGR